MKKWVTHYFIIFYCCHFLYHLYLLKATTDVTNRLETGLDKVLWDSIKKCQDSCFCTELRNKKTNKSSRTFVI